MHLEQIMSASSSVCIIWSLVLKILIEFYAEIGRMDKIFVLVSSV
jgi:hypothetical protein